MPNIPELLSGHVILEVECLDRLYLNGYIGKLATSGRLVTFTREQMGKPMPSPVVLGQVTEKFRGVGRQINRRLPEVKRVSHNNGLSGDSIQRVVQPTSLRTERKLVNEVQPARVMALFLMLTLFQHLIDDSTTAISIAWLSTC